jgi:hypothetical protein
LKGHGRDTLVDFFNGCTETAGNRQRTIPASEAPFHSRPASVEESAAAKQQHDEDDDEQSGRVHFLSPVFGERGPASSRPLTLVTNDGDSVPQRDRITPTPMCRLTAAQACVCSLLNTAINARPPECETFASRRALLEVQATRDPHQSRARKSGVLSDL